MKVVAVYRQQTDYTRTVEDYLRDFTVRTAKTIETLDPDSAAGSDFCGVYDIIEYPTFVALSEDGHLQNEWRGLPLPTIDELSYYV